MASILPALRLAAPRLTRRLFQCSHSNSSAFLKFRSGSCRRAPPQIIQTFASGRQQASSASAHGILSQTSSSPPLQSLSKSLGQIGKQKRARVFPKTSEKMVAYWLLGSAASVFGIVVFGGLTRLTESGLSITEWKPVTGSMPPMSAEHWDSEFNKYRSSPEFQRLNPNMTLSEFKSIYYMEWTHRLWGRLVGISFVVPAVYFIARRKISAPMALRITGIGGLIGFQGVLGWWMVKSGLKDDLFAPGSHPRVSQYRLVAHLGTAFLCYSAMLWNGLSILRTHKHLRDPQTAEKILGRLRSPQLRLFRTSVGALAVLVFITAMSGGLVAGLDAGLIYNEFPWMGLGLTPPKSELFSDFYSHTADNSDLWWRNPLENPSLVQLDHRILATTTFTSIMALWAYIKISPSVKKVLPMASRKGVHGVVGFAFLQVALGISTLIYLVPLPLASAHQAGSLALLSYVLVLGSRTWLPNRRVSSMLSRKLGRAGTQAKLKARTNSSIMRPNTLKTTPEPAAKP